MIRWISTLALALCLVLPLSAKQADEHTHAHEHAKPTSTTTNSAIQLGTDYIEVSQSFGTTNQDVIEVIEFFGYNCPHCAHAEPVYVKWKKTLAKDVKFIQEPAVFGGVWDIMAQAYYAAQSMNVLDKTHQAIFDGIHKENTIKNVGSLMDAYEQNGVNPKVFEKTMESFAVKAQIEQSRKKQMAWGIQSTPSIVVAGKYLVTVPSGHDQFTRQTKIVDQLIDKVRKERASAKDAPSKKATKAVEENTTEKAAK